MFNILLQVFDDGRLTDGQGRVVDFSNTVLIMTSNLGAEYLVAQKEGEDVDLVRGQVMDVVSHAFRPEFLNRIDDILLFRRLSRAVMTDIVEIQVMGLQKMLADHQIVMALDDKAKIWLADAGYDPAFGARPLKRVIQRELQNPLASQMIEGKIPDGSSVTVTADDNGLVIKPAGDSVAADKPAKSKKSKDDEAAA